jgi:TolA-binding protein
MKQPILIVISTAILIFNIITSGFSEETTAQAQLSGITKDIPANWWDGGWDKLKELQDFISNNPGNTDLCAKAQYYIGCYYCSTQQYQKAIEEYRALLKLYPLVAPECSKAQYEIGQITFNSLNKPKEAITEYRKVISDYPDSWLSPAAQLTIGRAYIKLQDKAQAKVELQKVMDNYPLAKWQRTEAYVELGDISMSEGVNKEALSYYKKAYLAWPPADSSGMVRIMDKIYEAFRGLDNSVARANQFIKYQKYGPAGADGVSGTPDDLTDPLAKF